MSILRLLIVDDEPLIRTGIRNDVATMEFARVAGECGSVTEAVDAIRANQYDLVLLDVQMPDGTGFDVIRHVGAERMPPVVFATAYDQYALQAFEVNAVDYLLKPFDDIRLRESIERVRQRLFPAGGTHQVHALVEAHNRLLATIDEQNRQARYTKAELERAGTVQQNLFPRRSGLIGGVEYAARCAPASNLSGDYYDFLDLGSGRLGIVLADVAGKGTPAALLMANLQGCFRTHMQSGAPEPVAMIRSINRLLYESTSPEIFATAFFGEYDYATHQLRYVSCGHLPPFVLRAAGGSADRLQPTGAVLGAFDQWPGGDAVTLVRPGDTLFAYTDGVTEALSIDGEEFGDKRLGNVLTAALGARPEEILDSVIKAVHEFSASASRDDITAVALKRLTLAL